MHHIWKEKVSNMDLFRLLLLGEGQFAPSGIRGIPTNSVLGKNIPMQLASLAHLPVEGTRCREECLDRFQGAIAGFRVD